MERAERERGFLESGADLITAVGLFVLLAGAVWQSPKVVGLGIAAIVGGLFGKSLVSSKPQGA